MKHKSEFVPPPEAPVFQPTEEEFSDPFEYIAKIRPVAEQYGICKIRPPSYWQPPFAVDINNFKFTPRIQKLNELEAKSRIRLHFLDHLARFWDLQHNTLKIPYVDNSYLDFYHLRKHVHEMDGYYSVEKHNRWPLVANLLGYSPSSDTCSQLRHQYSKVLLPYDVFVAGTSDVHDEDKKKVKLETTTSLNTSTKYSTNKNTPPTGNGIMHKPTDQTEVSTIQTEGIKFEVDDSPSNISSSQSTSTDLPKRIPNPHFYTSNSLDSISQATKSFSNFSNLIGQTKCSSSLQDLSTCSKLIKVHLERLPAEITTASSIKHSSSNNDVNGGADANSDTTVASTSIKHSLSSTTIINNNSGDVGNSDDGGEDPNWIKINISCITQDGGVVAKNDGGVVDKDNGDVVAKDDGGVVDKEDGGVVDKDDGGVVDKEDGGVVDKENDGGVVDKDDGGSQLSGRKFSAEENTETNNNNTHIDTFYDTMETSGRTKAHTHNSAASMNVSISNIPNLLEEHNPFGPTHSTEGEARERATPTESSPEDPLKGSSISTEDPLKDSSISSMENLSGNFKSTVDLSRGPLEKRQRKRGSSELSKLKFIGAGPKMSVPDPSKSIIEDESLQKRTRPKVKEGSSNKYSKIECNACGQTGGSLETIILCDTCLGAYHYSCLILPVKESNRLHWKCPNCIAKECKKPMPSFGFEQSSVEYTFKSFGEMADQFKNNHFNAPPYSVPTEVVEKEFWRLVNCLEEDVVVEYGADIHTLESGSGFPTLKNKHLVHPQDHGYITSAWNINNMPYSDHSLLKYVKADINGMKVPWMYIGMCFSSFAWHIEDHWSYSINYMHWGEPKTWYGVPGSKAGMLEKCMQSSAPELFEQFPDLLHQLTTIMSTNVLCGQGVPIYRLDQHAGEFVVTFPRSYHSGFNQGYNCAEAVNFCTPDWLPLGVSCIEDYRLHKRQCVFSNDELLCNAVSDCHSDEDACSLMQVFEEMVEKEVALRKQTRLMCPGLKEEQADFEYLSDDERQCSICHTTCYLSSISCFCNPGKMVCLYHLDSLCPCQSHLLKYKYLEAELQAMKQKLTASSQPLQLWRQRVDIALDAKGKDRITLASLRSLLKDHTRLRLPDCQKFSILNKHLNISEDITSFANHLQKSIVPDKKMDLVEFEEMVAQLDSLCCKLPCDHKIKDYAEKLQEERSKIKQEVCREDLTIDEIDVLFEKCSSLLVQVPEVVMLDKAMNCISWIEELSSLDDESVKVSSETLMRLIETGSNFTLTQSVSSKLAHLKELLSDFNRLQSSIEECINKNPPMTPEDLLQLHEECCKFKVSLPSLDTLSSCIGDYNDWKAAYDEAMGGRVSVVRMQRLLEQSKELHVRVDEDSNMQSMISKAYSWLSGLKKVLLKSSHDCLQVLLPRKDLKRLLSSDDTCDLTLDDDDDDDNALWRRDDDDDGYDVMQDFDFKKRREEELKDMLSLRQVNNTKFSLVMEGDKEVSHKFCYCKGLARGDMIQCRVCLDLFHLSCAGSAAPLGGTTGGTWSCSRCSRGKPVPKHLLESFITYHLTNLKVDMKEARAVKNLLISHSELEAQAENFMRDHDVTKTGADELEKVERLVVGADLLGVPLYNMDALLKFLLQNNKLPSDRIITFPDRVLPDVVQSNTQAPGVRVVKEEDDDDEVCSALKCILPSQHSEDVEWVQCDRCFKWFHLQCLGLNKHDLSDDFVCNNCSFPSKPHLHLQKQLQQEQRLQLQQNFYQMKQKMQQKILQNQMQLLPPPSNQQPLSNALSSSKQPRPSQQIIIVKSQALSSPNPIRLISIPKNNTTLSKNPNHTFSNNPNSNNITLNNSNFCSKSSSFSSSNNIFIRNISSIANNAELSRKRCAPEEASHTNTKILNLTPTHFVTSPSCSFFPSTSHISLTSSSSSTSLDADVNRGNNTPLDIQQSFMTTRIISSTDSVNVDACLPEAPKKQCKEVIVIDD